MPKKRKNSKGLLGKDTFDRLRREAKRLRWINERELSLTSRVMELSTSLQRGHGADSGPTAVISAMIQAVAELETDLRIKINVLEEAVKLVIRNLPEHNMQEVREGMARIGLSDIRR